METFLFPQTYKKHLCGSCAVNLNREPHLFADHVRAEIIGTEIIANYFAWRKGGGGGGVRMSRQDLRCGYGLFHNSHNCVKHYDDITKKNCNRQKNKLLLV